LLVIEQHRTALGRNHTLQILLENVEHCGGEPEWADTGILCHWWVDEWFNTFKTRIFNVQRKLTRWIPTLSMKAERKWFMSSYAYKLQRDPERLWLDLQGETLPIR